ncbi:ATP-binding cassette domain-containing protein [Bacillus badius]|uniref:UvrABC system protein A n=1 Tax=Bacillus badius TaxID=1455 RepID=A0ABR5APR0_BACBA|nr:excinuclease ABC subunit UvrA [Bacillus badius]KIL74817.1 Excinuclease ABC [Bacillus badius]KIL75821.1 Excinuclease ABC subunit A [Bacillus badius]MED4718497.1 excinuclease ABC subunit UvrA [Bacillus badius]
MNVYDIVIKGARENNLKNVNIRIPKRKITIFTGVSGSGKSSLVFDTISAEAQRQLNETFSAFIRNRLPRFSQPDTDLIQNLSTAVVIDQKRLGGNSRSTVGTVTDIYTMLRLLFSRIGKPFSGNSNVFSFNDPAGMCPKCSGVGQVVQVDVDKLLDRSKSLNEGAILFPAFKVGGWLWNTYTHSGLFDNDKRLADYTPEEWETLIHGKESKIVYYTKGGAIESDYEGLLTKFTRLYLKRDSSELSKAKRESIERFLSYSHCSLCGGSRLNQEALGCRINGYNIAQCAAMEIGELIRMIGAIRDPIAGPMVDGILTRLNHLVSIGLDYLSLDRQTATLSGGESQRIKMVRHLSSSLTDIIYIFDEPSVGLHPRDVHRLNGMLCQLRDKGNTVLVIEHDREVIEIADYIIDVGPHAGTHGGEIVYEGDFAGLLRADTLTGRYLKQSLPLKTATRTPMDWMTVTSAMLYNLKNVNVHIPVGVMTVVTGVAGSGKSTLINRAFLPSHPEAIVIDQSAVGTSIRSNPATYTGMMDGIRRLFAAANKVSASLFSFNSKGACSNCQGLGIIYTDLAFLEPIRTSCEICSGKRFSDEVLQYKLNGKSISDILAMTVREASEFFISKEDLLRQLQTLEDVGLGYVTLGQPLNTLSGGECQRIKLAGELNKKGNLYVMDEPTTGLHMYDISRLMNIMNRLVDGGNTVVVIEHNLDVIKSADWIIDMGPEGGHRGGQIVFEGTPGQLAVNEHSITGEYLRNAKTC